MLLIGNVGFAKKVQSSSIGANMQEWGTQVKIKTLFTPAVLVTCGRYYIIFLKYVFFSSSSRILAVPNVGLVISYLILLFFLLQLGKFDHDKFNLVIILLANNLKVNLFEVIYRNWCSISLFNSLIQSVFNKLQIN